MIRAILFDMGGTLDGDGVHWQDRFFALYENLGVKLSRESLREAFDAAERKAVVDETIGSSNLSQMTELYVKWQLAHLGLQDRELQRHLVEGFVAPMHATTAENAQLLATLAERGFELGVEIGRA